VAVSSRAAIIINPISGTRGGRDVARRRAALAAALAQSHGCAAEILITEGPGHGRLLADGALRQGASLVVAWGGDGTINEVASALAFQNAALGIVPSGSGNGLARELGIPWKPAAAFGVAFGERERVLDAGELDGRLFFNVAGIGFDARIAARFAEGGLKRRGFARYAEMTLRELFSARPEEVAIILNGALHQRTVLLVAIANARQYGNGACIAPRARVDDGRLDVVIVESRSPWLALVQAPALFAGLAARLPGVTMMQTDTAELTASRAIPYHVDGEPHIGGTTLRAQVHPGALRVRVRP
jgi:diacylglycerol kinase (ATP)